ncbi:hypothetical protein [Streptomyces sp. NPDC088789]
MTHTPEFRRLRKAASQRVQAVAATGDSPGRGGPGRGGFVGRGVTEPAL